MKITLSCPMCHIGFDMDIEEEPEPKKWYAKWIGDGNLNCPNCNADVVVDVMVYNEVKVPF